LASFAGVAINVPIAARTPDGDYAVVKVLVDTTTLGVIASRAATRTAPDQHDPNRPAVRGQNGVEDWEWDAVRTEPKGSLTTYLGSVNHSKAGAVTPGGKHALNWYHDIAINPGL
jgi:hypothetical protein